jgi:hypothetical protein
MIGLAPRNLQFSEADKWKQFGFAARQLEVFLDYLSCFAQAPIPYLLDPRFSHLLSPADDAFARFLRNLYTTCPLPAQSSPAWAVSLLCTRVYCLVLTVTRSLAVVSRISRTSIRGMDGPTMPKSKLWR